MSDFWSPERLAGLRPARTMIFLCFVQWKGKMVCPTTKC